MNDAMPLIATLIPTLLLGLVMLLYIKMRRQKHHLSALLTLSDAENRKERAKATALTEALKSEQAWSHLFRDRTSDLLFVFATQTATGKPEPFSHVNEAACTRLRYTRERLLALTLWDIEAFQPPVMQRGPGGLPPVGNPVQEIQALTENIIDRHRNSEFQRRIRRVREQGRHVYECVLMARDGHPVPVEIEATAFENAKQSYIVILARDLTEREHAREALTRSELRSRDYFTNAAIGAAVYDSAHALMDVNRIAMKILGTPGPAEFARFNPFDNPFVPANARIDLARGTTTRYEAEIPFDTVRDLDLFVSGRTGTAHLDILVTNLGLDRQYEPKGYFVQIQDITLRYTTEEALEHSERQLRQAQKMQAIGTLAGGIAHDFNNILTPILGYSEMAMALCEPGAEIREFMGEVVKASLRAKELANQILTFSRQTESEGRPIRIIPIVKEVAKLLQSTLPEALSLQVNIKTDRDIIIAEPTQIHQIIMNLCTNATHAMQGRQGVIGIHLTTLAIGRGGISEYPQLAPGNYLRISVTDTGHGMSAATAERIFEPFFTTKARGEGTGMGLAVVHGIVTSMKGGITLQSQPGAGTQFHMVLPLVELNIAVSDTERQPMPTGTECILFVDDEPEIVKLQSHLLASLGYRPVVTDNAVEALNLFRNCPERFDLVITDQVMPDLSGTDLARQIHQTHPNQPVLLCTGFSENFSPEQLTAVGIMAVLRKPVTRRDLAFAIRNVLTPQGNR